MINSYKQLTGKYLKSNKKRSLLTIIGIVLSVALISTIGLFIKGIQDAQIEDTKNKYGSYHLIFSKTNEDFITKIANNPKVSRSGLYNIGSEVKLGEELVLKELTATDSALELLPYRTKKGDLPENENEIAIEQWILKYLDKDAAIGKKIDINNNEYVLVGILENNIMNQLNDSGVALTKNNEIKNDNSVLLVEISSKTNLKSAVDELKLLGEKNSVGENTYLLQMQGAGGSNSGMSGLYMVIGIIIGIVVIATIAVIYNSFQISIVERIKQFGLLRAVGATPKQIRKIILREATFLALIGVPLGLLCGIIAISGISFAFKLIGGDSVLPMKLSVSPIIMGTSALVGMVSIYVSALIPSFFAGKISPLVAISSRTSISKEKIKKRKTFVARKLFGFEGSLASKNIKRNRKRYRITVFSIIISVVLFVTFKSFMDMSLNISADLSESKNVHFSVVRDFNSSDEGSVIESKIIDDLKEIDSIEKIYKVYNPYYFDMAIDRGKEIESIQNIDNENDQFQIYNKTTLNGKEKTRIASSIMIYDEEALNVSKKYLESGNIDIKKLNEENGVILIKKNSISNYKTKKTYVGPIADIKVGDEIQLQYNGLEEDNPQFGKGNIKKVKVMAILENAPFNFRGYSNGLKLITTEELGKKLIEQEDIKPINLNIVIDDINNEEISITAIEEAVKQNPSLLVTNNIDSNRSEKSSILMIQILLYGFVIVVSLISSVNIINTLTTNILLRKREFATLKSIGLTQKGLRKMIVLEGFLYGIVGTIYGSVIATGLSFLMFKGFGDIREFGWSIPWEAISIAGVSALIIAYISVLSPLSRINKENLIEAVREDY